MSAKAQTRKAAKTKTKTKTKPTPARRAVDAELLREALPYIRRFKGKTFVVKISGKVTEDHEVLNSLAEEIALLSQVGIRVTVVHGGGKQATELSERLGLAPRLINGRRITDDATLEVVKMVFAGKISVEILSALRAHGVHAVGVSGIDGNVVLARRRSKKRVVNRETGRRELIDFGNVGDVVDVDPRLLTTLLDAGYLPVVSPLAADEAGIVFNVNADSIASALATELRAEKLILLSDVPGVLRNRTDAATLVSRLTAPEARKLARGNSVSGGMVAKLEEAARVAESGVGAVHLIDGNQRNALLSEIFGDLGIGTMVVPG
ncbi:MAG TPA: acetylglutamate kinase [Thermoanaerobaculia bacterium]